MTQALLLAMLISAAPVAPDATPALGLAAADTTDGAPGLAAGVREAELQGEAKSPNVLRDHAVVYGATVLYGVAYADVRNRVIERGSWSNIAANFRDPIGRAIQGARNDDDPFETNYIAHPVSWGLVGWWFRSRGHSFWGSLAMSQGHSIFWEYVIEGSYAKPSGKDLITNFASSLLGIALADWLGAELPLVGLEVGAGPGRLAALPDDPLAGPGRRGPTVALTVRLAL